MKSTTGAHYLGLDHLRALAALLVVSWHFIHGINGYPVPFNFTPFVFPLVLFDEGHVGVSLFMTLSGYLFSKLLDGKQINFAAFLWNRCLRLLPLLCVTTVWAGFIVWVKHKQEFPGFLLDLMYGLVLPTLPNGGWSITVEFHFYLLLPILLWLLRRSKWLPVAVVIAAVASRTVLHLSEIEVQPLAYWTIVGRIDQFASGMIAFQFHKHLKGRHLLVSAVVLVFTGIYCVFSNFGGYWKPAYPSKSGLWIILPTVEAIAFSTLIAWYDSSFDWRGARVATLLGKFGEYSYSMYLLHFFFFGYAAVLVDWHVMRLNNFYVALAWAILFYIAMTPICYLSYRFIELPFMRYRKDYTIKSV